MVRGWRGNSGPDARAWCHVKEADDGSLHGMGSQGRCEAGSAGVRWGRAGLRVLCRSVSFVGHAQESRTSEPR